MYTEGAAAETETTEPATDPTIANAGLTEIDAGADIAITNGHSAEASAESANTGAPANADVGEGAANAAADSQWDAGNASMSASQEWVEVPREPAETDNGLNATPAAPANTQSWADDAADHAAEVPICDTRNPCTEWTLLTYRLVLRLLPFPPTLTMVSSLSRDVTVAVETEREATGADGATTVATAASVETVVDVAAVAAGEVTAVSTISNATPTNLRMMCRLFLLLPNLLIGRVGCRLTRTSFFSSPKRAFLSFFLFTFTPDLSASLFVSLLPVPHIFLVSSVCMSWYHCGRALEMEWTHSADLLSSFSPVSNAYHTGA